MRVRVLPREMAGRIINSTISTMGWAVGALTIAMTFPVLVETTVRAGEPAAMLLPLAMLLVIAVGIAAVWWWRRTAVVLGYLAIGAGATVVYEVSLLAADPSLLQDNLYLVNRPTLALVAVGVTATTALSGILWCCVGFGVATLAAWVSTTLVELPFRPGFGPTMVLAISVVGYLTFAAIQRSQRRRLPNFDELEEETRRLARGEDMQRRTTAAVHDTVLNDLSIIMNSPEKLDERAARRLLDDLDELRGAEWLSATRRIPTADEEDATLRNDIMRMVSDFQWRGLTIHVTGSGPGVYRLDPAVAGAVTGAIEASFENVLRHSGAAVAELELIYEGDLLTVMITDQGAGFDPQAMPPDRLGVRGSIQDRMRQVGGAAQVWSSPGSGTSIVLSVPIAEVVAPHPQSDHRRRDG